METELKRKKINEKAELKRKKLEEKAEFERKNMILDCRKVFLKLESERIASERLLILLEKDAKHAKEHDERMSRMRNRRERAETKCKTEKI